MQWRTAAEVAGLTVHAETQWESIEEAVRESGREFPWQDPLVGWCPPEVMVPLREILVDYTSTPDVVWFAMWVGFTDVKGVMERTAAPRFELPGREYALFKGPLEAADNIITSPHRLRISPSLCWPDDLAWCVATEVDFRWTYVGAAAECVQKLERDARLEALRTQPEHRGDIESDWPRELRDPDGGR